MHCKAVVCEEWVNGGTNWKVRDLESSLRRLFQKRGLPNRTDPQTSPCIWNHQHHIIEGRYLSHIFIVVFMPYHRAKLLFLRPTAGTPALQLAPCAWQLRERGYLVPSSWLGDGKCSACHIIAHPTAEGPSNINNTCHYVWKTLFWIKNKTNQNKSNW